MHRCEAGLLKKEKTHVFKQQKINSSSTPSPAAPSTTAGCSHITELPILSVPELSVLSALLPALTHSWWLPGDPL